MRILLVTEKFSPSESQCDGGARMVNTLTSGFKGIIRYNAVWGAKPFDSNLEI